MPENEQRLARERQPASGHCAFGTPTAEESASLVHVAEADAPSFDVACTPDGDRVEWASSPSNSESGSFGAPPCCSAWRNCSCQGRCRYDAKVMSRIHDEDGALVDVVSTRQFNSQRCVYKTYVAAKTLDWLVQEEVALLRRLNGRCHVIELLDTFTDEAGNMVLVMPYVADDFTPQRPSTVRSYMRQLLTCLAFLHDDCGIMHRNIKRANILFSAATHELTLIDFEGSCAASTHAVYTRFGNNLYRAPELVAAKPARGQAASVYVYNPFDDNLSPGAHSGTPVDIFSAGVVFAELLFGVRRLLDVDWLEESYAALRDALAALEADKEQALLTGRPLPDPRSAFAAQLTRGGPPAVARCSADAADLLARMLCFVPDARITAADALRHPYFTTQSADEIDDTAFEAAHVVQPSAPGDRRKRRRRG
jgi:serine/threonine protein kinase